jgi:predicted RNase H-like HicB family nuclease
MATHYVGILDGEGDIWGVRIPDVPGCHGGGDTPEAALADAVSALREVASHYAIIGTPLAAARSAKDIIADPKVAYDASSGESLVMVPLLLDRGRPVRANISLDAGLLETIDAEAKRRGLTRSAFLASAAIDKITQA